MFFKSNRIYSDRSELDLSMKPSEFKISISIHSYRNCYVAKKPIISKLIFSTKKMRNSGY